MIDAGATLLACVGRGATIINRLAPAWRQAAGKIDRDDLPRSLVVHLFDSWDAGLDWLNIPRADAAHYGLLEETTPQLAWAWGWYLDQFLMESSSWPPADEPAGEVKPRWYV